MFKVLVLCHANRWRSPLAAGCMRKAVGEWNEGAANPIRVEINSAGFKEAGKPAGRPVRNVAAELGFSLENHRSAVCDVAMVAAHDCSVVMDEGNFERLIKLVQGQQSCGGKSIFRLGEFVGRSRIEDLAFISPRTKPEKFHEVVTYINEACRLFVLNVIAPRAAKGQVTITQETESQRG